LHLHHKTITGAEQGIKKKYVLTIPYYYDHNNLNPPRPRGTVKKKGSIPRGFNLSLETRCRGRCRENPPFPEEREPIPHERKPNKKKRESKETRLGEENRWSTTLFYMCSQKIDLVSSAPSLRPIQPPPSLDGARGKRG
jgi:hypothetical protein